MKMAKLFQVVFVSIALAVCAADPIKFRGNFRSARQEVAPSSSPAPAPYPPAGITPAIAFELPSEPTTVKPDNTYLPPAPTPDQTYGPPDDKYGPPVQGVAIDAASGDQPAVDPQAERIIFVPRNRKASAKLRQQLKRTQRLRSARLQLEPIEIVRSQPVIAYSVQYKSF